MLTGTLLLRETHFHIANCLKSFDFKLFFVYTLKSLRGSSVTSHIIFVLFGQTYDLLQTFKKKTSALSFWMRLLQNRKSIREFCQGLHTFCPNCHIFYPDFHHIKRVWGAVATHAPPPPTPVLGKRR